MRSRVSRQALKVRGLGLTLTAVRAGDLTGLGGFRLRAWEYHRPMPIAGDESWHSFVHPHCLSAESSCLHGGHIPPS